MQITAATGLSTLTWVDGVELAVKVLQEVRCVLEIVALPRDCDGDYGNAGLDGGIQLRTKQAAVDIDREPGNARLPRASTTASGERPQTE
jgi:hypothetical protein